MQYKQTFLFGVLGALTLLMMPCTSIASNDKSIPLSSIRLFADVFEKIKASSIIETTDEQLFDNAINGMLSNLDPYSELLDIKRYNELLAFTEGDIADVGITVASLVSASSPTEQSKMGVQWKITAVTPRSSAAKAGLRVGDTIGRIAGQTIDALSQSDVEQALRGPQGTNVSLVVTSASNGKTKEYHLVCSTLENNDVQTKSLGEHVQYIQIKAFQQQTAMQVKQALALLKPDDKSIIIDLRDNPGGIVSVAVDAASLFLPKNTLITKSAGRGEQDQIYLANQSDVAKGLPIIILINRYTASAAEIFTAALQDNGRAKVLGQNSFGKAAIQKLIPLDDKHGLKLTVAMYQTPKGQNISGVGIVPNILLLEPSSGSEDDVLKKALALSRTQKSYVSSK